MCKGAFFKVIFNSNISSRIGFKFKFEIWLHPFSQSIKIFESPSTYNVLIPFSTAALKSIHKAYVSALLLVPSPAPYASNQRIETLSSKAVTLPHTYQVFLDKHHHSNPNILWNLYLGLNAFLMIFFVGEAYKFLHMTVWFDVKPILQ